MRMRTCLRSVRSGLRHLRTGAQAQPLALAHRALGRGSNPECLQLLGGAHGAHAYVVRAHLSAHLPPGWSLFGDPDDEGAA